MKWIYLLGPTHCTFNKKAECYDSFLRDQTTMGGMRGCSELFWIQKQLKEIGQVITNKSLVTVIIPVLKKYQKKALLTE